jgi:hypothetical protein
MRRLLQTVSWLSCAASLLPSVLFLIGQMTLDQVKLWTLVATVVWFVVTPLWMGREHGELAPAAQSKS